MAIPFNRDDREREKFVEANSVAGLPAVAVVNPDGSNISSGGGGGSSDVNVHDGSGNAITSTVVGSDRGLDVNVISGINVEVDLDAADDSVLVYGFDGVNNQKIATDTNGHLQIDVLSSALPSGAATEATLLNVYSDTTDILAKVTDIETNTDILANITDTTIGADVGLDVNVINTVDVAVSEANDSILIYAWDGTSNQKVKSNSSGQLEISLEVDNIGLATETTLQAVETDTSSIDTKLTTTNAKLTDIETNTDALAGVTKTTVGSDTGLDVNIIAGGGSGGGDQYVDGYTLVSGEKGNVMLGSDGTNLQFLDVNSSGQLNLNNISGTISLPTGAATETTLSNIYSDTTSILAKVTDIETNTDSLANVTNTTVGADTGLDVNLINTAIQVIVDESNDSILIYAWDGTSNQKVKSNTSGQLEISLEVDNIGLATEATLLNVYSDTTSIDTSTQSIDTKLTTTNAKLTDIETNTDILANLTSTTIGADTGLDVNVINTVDVEIDQANDSILIYGFDGAANQKVSVDTSGQLKVSLEVDNIGLATEATLLNVYSDTTSIDTSTQSIDTKLTTTNSLLTDIETNTDSLASVTNTTIGADTGLDVNVISSIDVSIDQSTDSILIYGWDGTSNQKVKTNTSGQLEVSIDVDNVGLATEATLSNLDATATLIQTDTNSIDTKLTTTNTLLTDIETNTDSLANVTQTTIGAKKGLDVNVANVVSANVTPEIISRLTKDQDSGTGNMAFSVNPGTPFKLISVNLAFFAVPTANDFVIGIEDLADPVYNTQIFKANPGNLGITNISWYPDGEVIIPFDQGLLFTFTNTATTQYGLTVVYETLA